MTLSDALLALVEARKEIVELRTNDYRRIGTDAQRQALDAAVVAYADANAELALALHEEGVKFDEDDDDEDDEDAVNVAVGITTITAQEAVAAARRAGINL